jgi:hypothetical protein
VPGTQGCARFAGGSRESNQYRPHGNPRKAPARSGAERKATGPRWKPFAGVFNAWIPDESQGDNPGGLRLLEDFGDTRREWDAGVVELVVELPPKRGMGARLAVALRVAAAGNLVPARTLAYRGGVGVASSRRPSVRPGRQIRTIVVGADGSETGGKALAVALSFGHVLGAALHVVSAYGVLQAPSDAEAVLEAATRAARAEGLEAVTHARRGDPAEALIAVAEEQHADLLVVGNRGMWRGAEAPASGRYAQRAPAGPGSAGA